MRDNKVTYVFERSSSNRFDDQDALRRTLSVDPLEDTHLVIDAFIDFMTGCGHHIVRKDIFHKIKQPAKRKIDEHETSITHLVRSGRSLSERMLEGRGSEQRAARHRKRKSRLSP